MPHGKIQRVITAKTASRRHHLRRPVPPFQIRQKFVDHIALVLHMAPDPRSWMYALVVPALAVHAVYAEYLDRSRFQFAAQRGSSPNLHTQKNVPWMSEKPGSAARRARTPTTPCRAPIRGYIACYIRGSCARGL